MALGATKDTDWYSQVSRLEVKAISSAIEVDIGNSAVKQSIPRDWLPIIFAGYEEPLPVISLYNRGASDSSDQSTDGWLSRVREALYSNPSVEDIFFSIEYNNVDVWVVIPERDLSILHQIVEREWELIKTFVSGKSPAFLFDFHIIYRCGRNIDELAPTRAIRLPRQGE